MPSDPPGALRAGPPPACVYDTGWHGLLQELMPAYTTLLGDLIRQDTSQGHEGAALDRVRHHMERLGLAPQAVRCRADAAGYSLAGCRPGYDPERYRSLVLSAHLDTAPVDCPERWSRDPWGGQVHDGRIHGRGACDDKAGIAVILMVAEALARRGLTLGGQLLFHVVVEDETSSDGTLALVQAGFGGDGAVICDGTWPERIVYAHLGQVWLDVIVRGEPVAACNEARGVNPIRLAGRFIERLDEAVACWNAAAVPFETLERPYFANVGSIHAGVWPGSVPAEARLQVQIGFPEGSAEAMERRVRDLAAELSERISVSRGQLACAPVRKDKDGPLVTGLKRIIERNGGRDVRLTAVSGHADMRHFPVGDVCLYGPGGGYNPHGIDESYILDHMVIVAANILDLVVEWCGLERTSGSG